jgi:hypothetical protein
MKMVGHNNHLEAPHIGIFIFQFVIPFSHHLSGIVQLHFPVVDLAKQTGPVFYTDGYEIQSGPGVIVSSQTEVTAMMK